MEYPSKLIEDAVNEVAKLPGIGKKTALRLVLHLIKENENRTVTALPIDQSNQAKVDELTKLVKAYIQVFSYRVNKNQF